MIRCIPIEDHSRVTGFGEYHFSRVKLFGGPQASTFLPGIKELSILHVPNSHCICKTKHTGDREEGESSRMWDGPRVRVESTDEILTSGAVVPSLLGLSIAKAKNNFAPSRACTTSSELEGA